ncbi:hypothetical protein E1189_13860 [Sansalvadorimonas verongulae]|nr:hypothetical protein [Sansalvadorimonas verongulae]
MIRAADRLEPNTTQTCNDTLQIFGLISAQPPGIDLQRGSLIIHTGYGVEMFNQGQFGQGQFDVLVITGYVFLPSGRLGAQPGIDILSCSPIGHTAH